MIKFIKNFCKKKRGEYTPNLVKKLDSNELFRSNVIDLILKYLDMYSKSASDLLLGTALIESNLDYVIQLGGGPAKSLFQIEPNTLKDCYDNYLNYRPELKSRIDALLFGKKDYPNRVRNLEINPQYACAIARIIYRRKKGKLPNSSIIKKKYSLQLSSYWKTHYNTNLGKGTIEKANKIFTKIV